MAMTKKDFIALADLIREYPNSFSAEGIDVLGTFCYIQNKRFNVERWLGYIYGIRWPNGRKRGN